MMPQDLKDPNFVLFWKNYGNIIVPIVTFLLGFFTQFFFMSKKDRFDASERLQQHVQKLQNDHNDAYEKYTSVMGKVINKDGKLDVNDFIRISTSGENYFRTVKSISEAILEGNFKKSTIKDVLSPLVRDALHVLPIHYDKLLEIAEKNNFDGQKKLNKENYRSLYLVAEKYPEES
ncbi:hypothetical protein [Maridesulfovibrio sp.]|uniref:hypothetical protein n=1 Tax=Maridesulfovibrio sp. TaxID=2795000 RepID=UPI002AA7557A|nr:hypothetical protein [Maridesulfovibrio sp.]